jgi:hypothetical protein
MKASGWCKIQVIALFDCVADRANTLNLALDDISGS